MAIRAPLPAMPPAVAAVFEAYPPQAQKHLCALRQLIFDTAASLPGAGPLTETLKWGEPAYLTEATKSGTTVRLGWSAKHPAAASLFVSCQTSLIEDWRAQYGQSLTFIGNREIRFPLSQSLPAAPIRHCIAMALTYHKRKSAP
jgi:Domain of unknown function (DU1801)